MRILITGGSGFIGTNTCLEAKRRGHEVIAMDSFVRPKSEENIPILKKAGVKILRADVREMVDFHRSPLPEAIIHFAGNPGIPWSINWPTYDFEVNARGTLNVLEYSRVMGDQLGKKIPVIYASTNKVYTDLVNKFPLVEEEKRYRYAWDMNIWDDPKYQSFSWLLTSGLQPDKGISEKFPIDGFGKYHHSPYGVSKLAGDQYCQEYYQTFGVPTVINRMSCIYGLYQKGVQDQGWIDHFIRKIAFGDGKLNFFGDGKQVRDMLWGGDVARLYLDELENIDKVKGQVFNIGGGVENTMSLIEAVACIEEISGKKATIKHYDWRLADQKVYISDISKVKEKLGWQPKVSPKEGIEKIYLAYYQGKGL